MTFKQLLAEKMVKSFKAPSGQYLEVYKDPTMEELDDLIPERSPRERLHIDEYTHDQLGAYLTPRHVWAWDRLLGDHDAVQPFLTKLGIRHPYYPAYIEVFVRPVKTRIRIARYTMSSRYPIPTEQQLTEFLRNNRGLNVFPKPIVWGFG